MEAGRVARSAPQRGGDRRAEAQRPHRRRRGWKAAKSVSAAGGLSLDSSLTCQRDGRHRASLDAPEHTLMRSAVHHHTAARGKKEETGPAATRAWIRLRLRPAKSWVTTRERVSVG